MRLRIAASVGGTSMVPRAGDPSLSVMGLVGAAGTRVYQVWFRDAQGFCTPSTFNLTNAVEIVWTL